MDPQGKSAFVTGGARGLGRGVVTELLSRGAKVLFCDVNGETGRATEAELQKQYGADVVFFHQADLSSDDQHRAAFETAVSKFGSVEICVNNAGILNENAWENMLAINAGSHIRGSLLALEHMRRDCGGRGGVIINVVSAAGLYPRYYCPAYVASKHAVMGFTSSWATNPDQKSHGVRWCCLCPHGFKSEILASRDDIFPFDRTVHLNYGTMEIPQVVEALMMLLQDTDNNGAILEVSLLKGAKYRRRQVVDRDGVSDLVIADTY